jgi:hypothetical protein
MKALGVQVEADDSVIEEKIGAKDEARDCGDEDEIHQYHHK